MLQDQKKPGKYSRTLMEEAWVIIGKEEGKLWWGYRREPTLGTPTSVEFNHAYVFRAERDNYPWKKVIGFMHTHPGMKAIPSLRDDRTLRAWILCLGKPLVSVIHGSDGLKGYWYDPEMDDDEPAIECQVKRFMGLLVGTTEVYD